MDSLSSRMDGLSSRSAAPSDVQVLNQKADSERRHRLQQLEQQLRSSRRQLQQRRRSLAQQRSRVGTLQLCEPKATVDIAMRDIHQHLSSQRLHREVHTSHADGRGQRSDMGVGRSISAPPPVRPRGHVWAGVSLLQMKNLATIDSICEKEEAQKLQREREEEEMRRRIHWEGLHNKVQEFIEKLNKRRINLEFMTN